jgi:hypothetical protein
LIADDGTPSLAATARAPGSWDACVRPITYCIIYLFNTSCRIDHAGSCFTASRAPRRATLPVSLGAETLPSPPTTTLPLADPAPAGFHCPLSGSPSLPTGTRAPEPARNLRPRTFTSSPLGLPISSTSSPVPARRLRSLVATPLQPGPSSPSALSTAPHCSVGGASRRGTRASGPRSFGRSLRPSLPRSSCTLSGSTATTSRTSGLRTCWPPLRFVRRHPVPGSPSLLCMPTSFHLVGHHAHLLPTYPV